MKLRIVQNPPSDEFKNEDSLYLAEKKLAEVQNIDFAKLVGAGIMHTKLWLVDSKHFYVGSANMDWRSLTQVILNNYCITNVSTHQSFADSGERIGSSGNGLRVSRSRRSETV